MVKQMFYAFGHSLFVKILSETFYTFFRNKLNRHLVFKVVNQRFLKVVKFG